MAIITRPGSDSLYMKFVFQGKQYFRSCHTTSMKYAEKKERGVLTTDGVHLNEAGNRFVAGLMLKALGE